MEEKVTVQSVSELFESKDYTSLRNLLAEIDPYDIAVIFEQLGNKELPIIFRLLPKELAAEVFVEMESDLQKDLISSFNDKELEDMLKELYVDDTVDIMEEMPANVVKRILSRTDSETRGFINEILKYPKDSAGSIMTVEYIRLDESMTVADAFKRIRRIGFDRETIYTCYVTEPDKKLIGLVTVKDLLLTDEDSLIGDIMQRNVIYVNTTDDREFVAQEMNKYDFLAIPVVDGEKRLVGIVTIDDAMDVLQEETTEDIQKMAGINPSGKPYLKTSVFHLWYKRIPWLMLLMVSATFTGSIISAFEDAISAMVVLAVFIPMLMDTGGNSGGQAAATIIIGLSLGDISKKDILKVIWKEFRVALICGFTLSVVGFAKAMIIDKTDVLTALVVCITLIFVVIIAKVTGCVLPIFAKRLGFDPAVMSSPIITTVVDVLALLVYFGIATALLPQLK